MTYALTALVVAILVALYVSERQRFDRELAGERRRGDDLLDRLMARSHEQYKAFAPGIPDYVEPDVPGSWVHDETGLLSTFVPEGSPEDATV